MASALAAAGMASKYRSWHCGPDALPPIAQGFMSPNMESIGLPGAEPLDQAGAPELRITGGRPGNRWQQPLLMANRSAGQQLRLGSRETPDK
jgi:hypothetical protein